MFVLWCAAVVAEDGLFLFCFDSTGAFCGEVRDWVKKWLRKKKKLLKKGGSDRYFLRKRQIQKRRSPRHAPPSLSKKKTREKKKRKRRSPRHAPPSLSKKKTRGKKKRKKRSPRHAPPFVFFPQATDTKETFPSANINWGLLRDKKIGRRDLSWSYFLVSQHTDTKETFPSANINCLLNKQAGELSVRSNINKPPGDLSVTAPSKRDRSPLSVRVYVYVDIYMYIYMSACHSEENWHTSALSVRLLTFAERQISGSLFNINRLPVRLLIFREQSAPLSTLRGASARVPNALSKIKKKEHRAVGKKNIAFSSVGLAHCWGQRSPFFFLILC